MIIGKNDAKFLAFSIFTFFTLQARPSVEVTEVELCTVLVRTGIFGFAINPAFKR